MRTPPLFPDAVTLIQSPLVPDLLARIDTSSGCTIKDSFASLDLAPEGFRVLFDAKWIASPAHPEKSWNFPPAWTRITDPDGLGLWEEAWCHDDEPRGLFLPELLSHSVVVVLGRMEKDRIVAGGIVSRGTHVAGISNVFAEVGRGSETWSCLAQCARACFPNLPLVGYQRGEELRHAQSSGFQIAGALRVWIASS